MAVMCWCLCISVPTDVTSGAPTVSTVTSTSGLVWKRQAKATGAAITTTSTKGAGYGRRSALRRCRVKQVAVPIPAPSGRRRQLLLFALSGANTTTPFDPNSSLHGRGSAAAPKTKARSLPRPRFLRLLLALPLLPRLDLQRDWRGLGVVDFRTTDLGPSGLSQIGSQNNRGGEYYDISTLAGGGSRRRSIGATAGSDFTNPTTMLAVLFDAVQPPVREEYVTTTTTPATTTTTAPTTTTTPSSSLPGWTAGSRRRVTSCWGIAKAIRSPASRQLRLLCPVLWATSVVGTSGTTGPGVTVTSNLDELVGLDSLPSQFAPVLSISARPPLIASPWIEGERGTPVIAFSGTGASAGPRQTCLLLPRPRAGLRLLPARRLSSATPSDGTPDQPPRWQRCRPTAVQDGPCLTTTCLRPGLQPRRHLLFLDFELCGRRGPGGHRSDDGHIDDL